MNGTNGGWYLNTKANGKTIGTGMDTTLSDSVMSTIKCIARMNAGYCVGVRDSGGKMPDGFISPEMSDENIMRVYNGYNI